MPGNLNVHSGLYLLVGGLSPGRFLAYHMRVDNIKNVALKTKNRVPVVLKSVRNPVVKNGPAMLIFIPVILSWGEFVNKCIPVKIKLGEFAISDYVREAKQYHGSDACGPKSG